MCDKNSQEIIDLKKTIQKMERLTIYDSNTKLPNKYLLTQILKKSIANTNRNSHSIALILININEFNCERETLDDYNKDEIFNKIAKAITRTTREGDVIAKLKNDTFAVVLEQLHDEKIVPKIVHKVLNAINLSSENNLEIQCNAGVALAPNDTKSVKELFSYSQTALDDATYQGDCIYRLYSDTIVNSSMINIAYEDALRDAINNKKLELYYQPQINLQTDIIVGAEILLRWNCKKYGHVPPEIFIPLADETGLIHKIGYFVLDEATIQLKEFNDQGYDISLAINLSTNQVKYQNIVKMLEHSIKKSSCTPQNLVLEITEDALYQKKDEAIKLLQDIKNLGAKITIDRFGSGHSSIASLRNFSLDSLKIDSSFLEDEKLLSSIIQTAKALGLQVIGQNVEHPSHLEFLREEKCDLYQGFIKSKPVNIKKFKEMLREQSS